MKKVVEEVGKKYTDEFTLEDFTSIMLMLKEGKKSDEE